MAVDKKGVTLIVPCNAAQALADRIECEAPKDQDLIDLAAYLRTFTTGAAYICVAPEDFVLWPDGPDIRDFQLGGGKSKVHLIHGDAVYSNDPADLPTADSFLKQSVRIVLDCPPGTVQFQDSCIPEG